MDGNFHFFSLDFKYSSIKLNKYWNWFPDEEYFIQLDSDLESVEGEDSGNILEPIDLDFCEENASNNISNLFVENEGIDKYCKDYWN